MLDFLDIPIHILYMANEIQVLKQTELLGQQFAVYGTPEEPLFLAKDVAAWIEHTDTSKMVQCVDEDEKLIRTLFVSGQNREVWMLTENGLYEILMQSRKPIAKEFKKGVKKILHEIRTVGGYMTANDNDTADELMARALIVAQRTLERREERIRLLEAVNTEQAKAISEMSPKATYYNIILQSPSTITVTQIAQDYGMSAKAFNKLLHSLGIQRKVGRQWVLYSEYISNGYVQSATEPMKNSRSGRSYTYSRWTQKGRIFLYNELKNRGVLPLIEQAA